MKSDDEKALAGLIRGRLGNHVVCRVFENKLAVVWPRAYEHDSIIRKSKPSQRLMVGASQSRMFRAIRSTALATHSQSLSLHFARGGTNASCTFFAPCRRTNDRSCCSTSVVIGARNSGGSFVLGFLGRVARCFLPRVDRRRRTSRERLSRTIIEGGNSRSVATRQLSALA